MSVVRSLLFKCAGKTSCILQSFLAWHKRAKEHVVWMTFRAGPFRYTCPNWRTSMRLLLTLVLAATAFAETHQFTPTKFYNTFSGAHPPVLHIKPGDHGVTSTLDAGGFDSAGVKRGERPNPQTAPV